MNRENTQEACPFNNDRFVQITGERDYLPRVPRLAGVESNSGSEPDSEPDPGTHTHPHTHRGPATASPPLIDLMRMTWEEWDLWTRGSAIRRAGYGGFKRNVAVAMGNWLASVDDRPEDALAVLRDALDDEEPLVREHAAWALEQLRSRPSPDAQHIFPGLRGQRTATQRAQRPRVQRPSESGWTRRWSEKTFCRSADRGTFRA